MRGNRAIGVRVIDQGRTLEITAERETILCGGVFGSPQLLMLSGIGPAEDLHAADIAQLIDLPVGRNPRDHLSVGLAWAQLERSPFQSLLRLDHAEFAMARALLLHDGPATSTIDLLASAVFMA
jgi:choline dehydrogenase